MPGVRVRALWLVGLIWLLSSGVAFAQQGAAPMVITFPAPSEVGFPDERPAVEVLNGGMFVFVGDVLCAEVDLSVSDQVEIGLEGQPAGCSDVGGELNFADFDGGFYALTHPLFELGTTFAFDGYAPVPSGWSIPQSICDVLASRDIEPRTSCGRLGVPELLPASTGSCLTPYVLHTTFLTPGDPIQLFIRRVDGSDAGRLIGSPTTVPTTGQIEMAIPPSELADGCVSGGVYEVSFAFGDPPVAEKKSALLTVFPPPQPADTGNGGFVTSDNVGRTTAVIGLVVLTFAVIAARFITYFASGSRASGRRR